MDTELDIGRDSNSQHLDVINTEYVGMISRYNIHLLHAGEGNMKIYSPKSIIFPEGNARGGYDTRG